MALTPDEVSALEALAKRASVQWANDERMLRYYNGVQRLAQLGLAVPPELRRFEMVVNWPRVTVNAVAERSDVKSVMRLGENEANPGLMELFEANNLASEVPLLVLDKLIYGRGFTSVGANEDDRERPLVRVESPREITVDIDPRRRRMNAALRLYGGETPTDPQYATLYLPDVTVWAEKGAGGKWVELDRDAHKLGRVPLVLHLNRRLTGDWLGRSEMSDIIPITDAAARSLTNMQLAAEMLAVPKRYVLGATAGDFIDQATGEPLTAWEAYIGSMFALGDKDAKVGQLAGADLKNFHETINLYGQLAASVTGYPGKYFGQFTTNPPAEGAIRADEARIIKTTERSNGETGTGLGWTFDLAERIRTGEWPTGNRVKFEWHDPGTPTFAQRADALQKLAGGVPIISREGAWDELGWNKARKDRERGYFERESQDPYLGLIQAKDAAGGGSEPPVVG